MGARATAGQPALRWHEDEAILIERTLLPATHGAREGGVKKRRGFARLCLRPVANATTHRQATRVT